jgi:hypothetical protein
VLDVLDRTRHSMCFFESPASVMTADGGRLYASFQDKCTHVGYVVHALGMNARMYGSIENRHRMFFGLVRSDIHDKLGPMIPPMPTTTSPADMRTMQEALSLRLPMLIVTGGGALLSILTHLGCP